jgi:hypothetical protein
MPHAWIYTVPVSAPTTIPAAGTTTAVMFMPLYADGSFTASTAVTTVESFASFPVSSLVNGRRWGFRERESGE